MVSCIPRIQYPRFRPTRISVPFLAFGVALHLSAQVQGDAQERPHFVTVGISTFHSAEAVMREDSRPSTVRNYLANVARKSYARKSDDSDGEPLLFEVALGNYYQVYDWLVQREIDAAVVSAFTATLLERRGIATAVAEFRDRGDADGHCPLIAAGSGRAKVNDDPISVYRTILHETLAAASDSGGVDEAIGHLGQQYDIAFVTHFSSSAFIAPLLFANSWLESKAGSASVDVRRRFWDILLGVADFSLYHRSGNERNPTDGLRLRFTYSGQGGRQLQEARGDLSDWYAYDPGDPLGSGQQILIDDSVSDEGVPCNRVRVSIPNDHLVVRNARLEAIRTSQPAFDTLLTTTPTTLNAAATRVGYIAVDQPNAQGLASYEGEISELFGCAEDDVTCEKRLVEDKDTRVRVANLRDEYRTWYLDRRFQFRISETLDILKQDARVNKQTMALVLPGGGVKALYQTKVLDHLYTKHGLTNVATPGNLDIGRNQLAVDTIVGTSGGAMVGLFAALRPGRTYDLICAALKRGVFPFWDLLRYASFIVIGLVLMAVVVVVRIANPKHLPTSAGWSVLSGWRARIESAASLAVLFATPFLIHHLRHGHLGSITLFEGFLFMLLTLLCHIVLVGGRLRVPEFVRLSSNKPLIVALATSAVACYLVAFLPYLPEDSAFWPTSLSVSGSIFLVATVLASPSRTADADDRGNHGPLVLLAILLAVVVLSYTLIIALQRTGLTSVLELTGRFWISLIASSFVASALTVGVALLLRGRIASHFWRVCMPGNGLFRFSSLAKLLTVSGCAFTLWTLVVAPAIYSSSVAEASYKAALNDLSLDNLEVNLIVTGSVFEGTTTDSDLYFCLPAEGGKCPDREDGQWDQAKKDQRVDAVIASGAPFPIFPPRHLDVDDGRVAVVDGGYTHNVPLHAAWLTNSRRVLVVHSGPFATDESPFDGSRRGFQASTLVTYANRIIPFLFERAQAIDRHEAGNMIVASLAPTAPAPGDPRYPSMSDFTAAAERIILDTADGDLGGDARIGRFDHWGRPALEEVRPHHCTDGCRQSP